MPKKGFHVPIWIPDPKGKKIEYEERRDRLQTVLEKRRAKFTDDPKKNPGTENSKKL